MAQSKSTAISISGSQSFGPTSFAHLPKEVNCTKSSRNRFVYAPSFFAEWRLEMQVHLILRSLQKHATLCFFAAREYPGKQYNIQLLGDVDPQKGTTMYEFLELLRTQGMFGEERSLADPVVRVFLHCSKLQETLAPSLGQISLCSPAQTSPNNVVLQCVCIPLLTISAPVYQGGNTEIQEKVLVAGDTGETA